MVAQGHILDANTLALWRMDDTNADPRTTGPLDSTDTRWTLPRGGSDCVVGPAPGTYARRLLNARTLNGQMHRVSAGGDPAKCIGSWTVEAFVLIPTWSGYTNNVVFAHAGTAPDTAPYSDNILLSVYFGRVTDGTGTMSALWEYAGGANQTAVAGGGTGVINSNTWYHVAWVKDSGAKTVTFWINGVQQGSAIAYANEATLGSAGNWILGRWATNQDPDSPAAQLAENSNMQIRDISFSTVTRAAPWLLANAALLTTTGTLITDASTYFSVPMDEVAAVDSGPNNLDLFSQSLVVDANIAHVSEDGLICVAGSHCRYLDECGLAHPAYSSLVRNALTGSATFEAWIWPTPTATRPQGLFCHGIPGTETQATNFVSFEIETDGALTFWVEHGAGLDTNVMTTAAGLVPAGRLTHVAWRKTMTGATWTGAIFVDGVMVMEVAGLTNYDGGTDPTSLLIIGRGDYPTITPQNYFIGYMDDVRLSSIARSNAEILESYRRGTCRDTASGLVSAIAQQGAAPVSASALGDIRITWSVPSGDGDASIVDGDVAAERGLRTAVLLSLFTDRRAEADDVPPSGDPTDRRGWWADQFAIVNGDKYGSRLWLLDRSKRTSEAAKRAEEYAREALAWMLEDKVVASIDVTVEMTAKDLIIGGALNRPGKDPVSFRFARAWDYTQEET